MYTTNFNKNNYTDSNYEYPFKTFVVYKDGNDLYNADSVNRDVSCGSIDQDNKIHIDINLNDWNNTNVAGGETVGIPKDNPDDITFTEFSR